MLNVCFVYFFIVVQCCVSFKYSSFSLKNHVSTSLKASVMNIATYNVLSSKLSDSDMYSACKPEHLFPPSRLLALKKKLQPEMNKRCIICLQEITNEWAGELHTFFSRQGYHFLTALYGSKLNGYMGVAIAVPLDKYDIIESDVMKIGESKSKMKFQGDDKKGWSSAISKVYSAALNLWPSADLKHPSSLWDAVRKRENQMLCTRIQSKANPDESFVVGTYHMPCAYTNPELMVLHCALSVQYIEWFSRGLPFVYTGDFNFKPYTTMFDLLTSGSLDPNHPEYPKLDGDDNWRLSIKRLLCSAYHTPSGPGNTIPEYIETFDYIFCTPEWKVNSVGALPPRGVWRPPMPNAVEPSNHFLHSASLTLPENWCQYPESDW